MQIAVIGGTGQLGQGLSLRFARAGHEVVLGSRTREKAEAAAREASQTLGSGAVSGTGNAEAASLGDVVVLSVPFEAQVDTLLQIRESAAGKVVIDATVPLSPGNPTQVSMPPEGSAAERAQLLLPQSPVVAAFHHVGARSLSALDKPLETDVLICGDDLAAKTTVIRLVASLGTKGIDCGPLRMAQIIERITPLLISLNMRYKRRHAGLRITGI